MPDQDQILNGNQHRIKAEQRNIQSSLGDLYLEQNETTTISPTGDVVTTVTINSRIIDGEKIDSVSQILGQCQEIDCAQYLTARTIRVCGSCERILCHNHAKFNRRENLYFCKDCLRSIRIKHFFLTLAWLIIAPFVKRIDE